MCAVGVCVVAATPAAVAVGISWIYAWVGVYGADHHAGAACRTDAVPIVPVAECVLHVRRPAAHLVAPPAIVVGRAGAGTCERCASLRSLYACALRRRLESTRKNRGTLGSRRPRPPRPSQSPRTCIGSPGRRSLCGCSSHPLHSRWRLARTVDQGSSGLWCGVWSGTPHAPANSSGGGRAVASGATSAPFLSGSRPICHSSASMLQRMQGASARSRAARSRALADLIRSHCSCWKRLVAAQHFNC